MLEWSIYFAPLDDADTDDREGYYAFLNAVRDNMGVMGMMPVPRLGMFGDFATASQDNYTHLPWQRWSRGDAHTFTSLNGLGYMITNIPSQTVISTCEPGSPRIRLCAQLEPFFCTKDNRPPGVLEPHFRPKNRREGQNSDLLSRLHLKRTQREHQGMSKTVC